MIRTIAAFADSHQTPIPERLEAVIEESEFVFFLGDGTAALGNLVFHYGFHGVSGNCDTKNLPEEEIIEIEGFKVLLTHGDKYNVKDDLTALAMRAKELDCNVVFYGHTHFAEIDRYENITFVCPGSIEASHTGVASYAYATIANGKFNAKIVNLS